jgi:hypothetical protein
LLGWLKFHTSGRNEAERRIEVRKDKQGRTEWESGIRTFLYLIDYTIDYKYLAIAYPQMYPYDDAAQSPGRSDVRHGQGHPHRLENR